MRKAVSSAVAAGLWLGALCGAAAAQDPGASRFAPIDKSGEGAVLCVYSIIAAMDEFLLAKGSAHPTRAQLQEMKQKFAEQALKEAVNPKNRERACGFMALLRQQTPQQVRANTKDLLAIPREPVMNPCL